MQLEVGMYVRTKYGIVKYINIPQLVFTISGLVEKNEEVINTLVVEDYILKASHNIIDLIEVGDYVNGLIVNDVVTDIDGTKTFNLFKQLSYFGNEDIKTIVTKEQFESMSYKVQ